MCFISVGRYLGIRNPLHARQANLFVSRRAVLWRIGIAWACSALIASPITMMSLHDHRNIVPAPYECAISNKYFLIFGSMLAFFIPMFVMVPSYIMTVRLLSHRAKFARNNSLLLNHSGATNAAAAAAANPSTNTASNQTNKLSMIVEYENGSSSMSPTKKSAPSSLGRSNSLLRSSAGSIGNRLAKAVDSVKKGSIMKQRRQSLQQQQQRTQDEDVSARDSITPANRKAEGRESRLCDNEDKAFAAAASELKSVDLLNTDASAKYIDDDDDNDAPGGHIERQQQQQRLLTSAQTSGGAGLTNLGASAPRNRPPIATPATCTQSTCTRLCPLRRRRCCCCCRCVVVAPEQLASGAQCLVSCNCTAAVGQMSARQQQQQQRCVSTKQQRTYCYNMAAARIDNCVQCCSPLPNGVVANVLSQSKSSSSLAGDADNDDSNANNDDKCIKPTAATEGHTRSDSALASPQR